MCDVCVFCPHLPRGMSTPATSTAKMGKECSKMDIKTVTIEKTTVKSGQSAIRVPQTSVESVNKQQQEGAKEIGGLKVVVGEGVNLDIGATLVGSGAEETPSQEVLDAYAIIAAAMAEAGP
jgi:hypothetical protein